jgi:TfoX/Sxy family transcriptional regulator of competence genes
VSLEAELMQLVLDAVEGLSRIERKRMFGFEALWADGRIFALVHQGRIALKLPESKAAAELLSLPGTKPFSVFRKQPGSWFFVPEELHDDPHALRSWAARAYELARTSPGRGPRVKGC